MTETPPKGLHLVPYNANDFSQGKALGLPQGKQITLAPQIGAALSLYFQWPEHRQCTYHLGSLDGATGKCTLSHDTDEVTPTELRIVLANGADRRQFAVARPIQIHFEIFNISYYFNSKVLALLEAVSSDFAWHVTIEPPTELIVQKQRGMPRYQVGDASHPLLSHLSWQPEASEKLLPLHVKEIGANFLSATVPEQVGSTGGLLHLGDRHLKATLKKINQESLVVITPEFQSGEEFSLYFNLYASIAFPTLRPKFSTPMSDVVEAYRAAGYLDKYLLSMTDNEKIQFLESLKATWEGVASSGETTMDYCSVDLPTGRITGASTACLAFFNGTREVWAITQYASIANPKNFAQTRELYLWRSVYLWARPGDRDVIAWIDSQSRWLERIWIKFARFRSSEKPCIWPVVVRVWNPAPDLKRSKSSPELKHIRIGRFTRKYLQSEGIVGAVDPKYLNAATLLNHVTTIPPSREVEALVSNARELAWNSADEFPGIRISLLASEEDASLGEYPIHPNQDRLLYFDKSELPYYYSSLAHSLAVMERKHREPVMA